MSPERNKRWVFMVDGFDMLHQLSDVKNARDTLNQIRGTYRDGEEKGREEGRAEQKLEIARVMLSKGMPPEMVADITGLSITEIKSL